MNLIGKVWKDNSLPLRKCGSKTKITPNTLNGKKPGKIFVAERIDEELKSQGNKLEANIPLQAGAIGFLRLTGDIDQARGQAPLHKSGY
ncbi:MAG: hypothetical protein R6U43_11905 [Candidatus Krumholzibacteriales bacterium]